MTQMLAPEHSNDNTCRILDMAMGRAVPGLTGSSDTNFRFSGLVEKDLDTAVMDLDAVRKAVCMFVGPETIIVGHG